MADTIVDQSFRPFILIDQAILDIPLTTDAFRVYAELKRYANRLGGCFPSYKTLGQCFKGSYPKSKDTLLRQKAIAAVKELVEWGLVRKEERRKDDESLTSNQYVLTPHTEWLVTKDEVADDKVVVGEDYPSRGGRLPLVVADDKVVVGEDPNKIQLTRSNTELDTLPPTPQGERVSEKKFGFEIPQEESNANTQALLMSETGTLRQTGDTLMTANVPPAKTDKFFTGKTQDQEKYERWAKTAHPALIYDGENTPWLEPPIGKQFVKFHQSFVDWHTARSMQKFNKQDRFEAEGDFVSALRNDPERCASRWAEYHKHMVTSAATAAARVNNGIEITEAEKQKFAKHQRALTGTTAESISGVDPKVLEATKSKSEPLQLALAESKQCLLEPASSVSDDIWNTVASEMEELEAREIAPEGAENVQAYQQVVNQEDRDYWAKFHASRQQSPELTTLVESATDIKKQIEQLKVKKSMPKPNNYQPSLVNKEQTKLEHWNNLMQTGIPSVIADVTRQAIAQGYLVENGQVIEPEF